MSGIRTRIQRWSAYFDAVWLVYVDMRAIIAKGFNLAFQNV